MVDESNVHALILRGYGSPFWGADAALHLGLFTGLARGSTESNLCGNAVYVRPPLGASINPMLSLGEIELGLQADFGYMPVPSCTCVDLNPDGTCQLRFEQKGDGSGALTAKLVWLGW